MSRFPLMLLKGNILTYYPRFTHYFGGEKTDVQYAHVKAMMSAIKADTDNYFTIKFECSGTAKGCTKTS